MLSQATACVVHSGYAQNTIAGRFPHLATHVLPQLYRNTSILADPDKAALIVSNFSTRHADVILQSVAECKKAGCKVRLHIGGSLETGASSFPSWRSG
ncbi:MAG: hypothetical protein U0892_06110 [Pirellulales bacterium]